MKKLFLVVLLLAIAAPTFAVTADVTGVMQLKGKAKSSDDFMELLKCGLTAIPAKFARKEKVEATYNGGAVLKLSQVAEDDSERYSLAFRVPSILRVFSDSNKVQKQKVKNGTVGVDCLGAEEEDPENPSSVESVFVALKQKPKAKHRKLTPLQKKRKRRKKFLVTGSNGAIFSVGKIVASRKGNKAVVKGTFLSKEDKAAGRFKVKFTYQDEEAQ